MTIRTAPVLIVGGLLWLTGCGGGAAEPMSVAALLDDPVYDEEVTVEGVADLVEELFCPCFELSSDGATVMVWYDLMEARGDQVAAVDITGIDNGDVVEVTGWLLEQVPTTEGLPDLRATAAVETEEGSAGLPNPASVFCEEQGGVVDIRSEPAGQVGFCVFPDGSECEEWAYYRGECVP